MQKQFFLHLFGVVGLTLLCGCGQMSESGKSTPTPQEPTEESVNKEAKNDEMLPSELQDESAVIAQADEQDDMTGGDTSEAQKI